MISDYESCVKHLYNIPFFLKDENKRSKSGNENLSVLMNELGNSHKNVKCIHIAGTNGKGSVANFIKCILKKSGYTVGVFTSPHLVDIRERIMLDGLISKEDFLDCFNKVSEAETKIVKEGYSHISYFEFMFAMAAVYFAKEKPDYVIYETGLGGRLDATNLLLPEITVITSIGFDHMKYLGDSIELIAGEKAFRDIESQVILELSAQNGLVIATGGGAILRSENVDALKANGKILFLDRPVEQLLPTDDRPLSSTKEAILQRYQERYPIYTSTADGVIPNETSPEAAVQQIERSFFQ